MNLQIHNLTKSFGSLKVLTDVNFTLEEGRRYCLMGPSGSGKTTLMRILLGLERADSGSVTGPKNIRFSAVFQEDRLCEAWPPLDNVLMTARRDVTRAMAKQELSSLLPEESITRPVFTLSGGMKRRTAICRALLAPYDIVLMDEPFTGLDDDTRKNVIAYIKMKTAGKILLLSTHQEEDIAALDAQLLRLRQTD